MQVTEKLNEGLRRELKIVVEMNELDRRLIERLDEMRGTVQLRGFRRGKAPLSHLRRTFTKQIMPELVQNIVQESTREALEQRKERAAVQPKLAFEGEESGLEQAMTGKADLAFTLEFEVMPEMESIEFSTLQLKKPVAEVQDSDIDDALENIRKEQKSYEPRDEKATAANGDRVTIDFIGSIDGEAFEGGTAEGAPLELGSGSFIPGFEEQLVGVVVGEDRIVTVTFPEGYEATHLAGKEAIFNIKVKEVSASIEASIDDDLAISLGFTKLDELRDAVSKRCEEGFVQASRMKLKRNLLDKLDELYKFDLPPSLVESEFDGIWNNVTTDLERAKRTFEDEGSSEDKAREDYRAIAERRVRLGLILAEVSEKNGIVVSDEEMDGVLAERTRQYPGQEDQVMSFYRNNPQAMSEIRSPLLEEKVVDFVLELADVSDETVTRDELFNQDDDDHDH